MRNKLRIPIVCKPFMGWLSANSRIITYILGSLLVILWTVIRHISNGVNFDVVGQIGLADQWSHGLHSGAQLGVTNYVLKIPLYMVINSFGFLSPMNRLLVLAVLCNVVTFVLLCVLMERVASLYRIKQRTWVYVGMLWLAVIAGNVFWVDYANSRNLETVGGMLLLYLALRYQKERRLQTAGWLAASGAIVFFADSLQLYVCGLGIGLFCVGQALARRTRSEAVQTVVLLGSLVVGWIGSKLLGWAMQAWLHISFLPTPKDSAGFTLDQFGSIMHGLVMSTLDIFGANILKRPIGPNTLRQLLGLVVLGGLLYLLLRAAANIRTRPVLGLGVAVIVSNYAVYVASGQVLVWATSRYLIMLPIIAVLVTSVEADRLPRTSSRRLQTAWLCTTLISGILLVGALGISWPDRHTKDTHIYSTIQLLSSNHIGYALGSRETGVTTTYFTQHSLTVLPMACSDNHRLQATDLFYDKAAFEHLLRYEGPAAVIVPATGIQFGINSCTAADVTAQFGKPTTTIIGSDGATIFVYPPRSATIEAAVQHYL